MKRRCIIGQSGGPTAVINATLAGVIQQAFHKEYEKVYGMVYGIEGLLDEKIIELNEFQDEERLEQLIHTPAMYLGSCRMKIPTKDESLYKKIFNILEKYEINDFFYIGGNDSMDTIKKLNHYAQDIHSPIHFIGIPKTIDNDLLYTDYTPGYPSSCRYVANTLLEIAFDSSIYPLKSVTIVEIMGRDAGWLTAAAQLVNEVYPDTIDFIYMPEITFNESQFVRSIRKKLENKRNIVVAVSEGIKDMYGMSISLNSGIKEDSFGHKSHSGCSSYLQEVVRNHINCKVRAIQLNILQRCSTSLVSDVDLKNAINIGKYAINCALSDKTGIMICISNSCQEYLLSDVSVDLVANKVKEFPINWINQDNQSIKKEYVDYVVPLIFESGIIELPQFCKRNG